MKKLNVTIESKEQRDELIQQLKDMTFEKELPNSWKELKKRSKIEIDAIELELGIRRSVNLKSDEILIKSIIAKVKLYDLMKVYNNGWKPDWSDVHQAKYFIYVREGKIKKGTSSGCVEFIYFKSEELRDKFMENFEDLIKDYCMVENNKSDFLNE